MIKTVLFLTALGLSQAGKIRTSTPDPDCPDTGHWLLPHEYDCTKFYYCEHGKKHVEPTDCWSGTEFSPTLQVCIAPTLAGCQLSGYPTTSAPAEETVSTPESSEEREDLLAGEGIETTISSTEETFETPTVSSNTTPDTATDTTLIPYTESNLTTNNDLYYETETTTTSALSIEETTTDVTTDAPIDTTTECDEFFENGCPIDFDVHLLLPHETSCRKFYYCVHGEKVLSQCNRGTIFNPELQTCVLYGSIYRTCEIDWSSEEDTSTEEKESSEEIEIERLPNGCPVQWDIITYLPHEYYCNKYYQCNFGELVERRCGPNTHFNPQLQVCDHIAVVNCTLPGGDASSEEVEDIAETTTREPIEWLENGCPADGYITWLLSHEADCTKFYYCVWGALVQSECPAGLHFSLKLQRCENPAIAGCICSGSTGECNNNESECTGNDCDNNVSVCTGNSCDDNDIPVCTGNNCDDDNVSSCTGNDCDDNNVSGCIGDNCDDNNVSGCTGNDCDDNNVSGCTGDNCDDNNVSGCTGNDCDDNNVSVCTGDNCDDNNVSGCTGNDCDDNNVSGCTGDNCDDNNVSGCTGNDCDDNNVSECTGNDCDDNNVSGCTGNDCDDNNVSGCTGNDCDDNVSTCTGEECDNSTSEENLPEDDSNSEQHCVEDSNESSENKKCEEECNVLPWAHEDCDKYWTCDGKTAVLVVCTEGLHFNPNSNTCDFACNAGCVRNNIETTAAQDGLKVFLPWNKIDDKARNLLKLIAN